MDMNSREFRTIVFEWLQSLTADHGFTFCKHDEGVRRITSSGFQSIGLILHTNFHYDFSFYHGIRINRIIDIVKDYLNIEPSALRTGHTTNVLLTHFPLPAGLPPSPVRGDQMLHASTEPELRYVLERLQPVYSNHIIPFLDAHQTVESVHELFTQGVGLYRHPIGGIFAIAAAYLAGAPNFSDIVEKYRAEVYAYSPMERDRQCFDGAAGHLLSGAVVRYLPPQSV